MVILSCSALQRWEGNFRASLWVYPGLRLSLVLDSRLFWFKPQDISRLHFSEKTLASKCFSLSAFASPTTSFESAPRSTPPSWMQSRMSQKKPGKLLQSLDLLWFMMIYACIHMFSYVFYKLSSQSNHWTLTFESWSLCLDPKGLQRRPVREFRPQKPASKQHKMETSQTFKCDAGWCWYIPIWAFVTVDTTKAIKQSWAGYLALRCIKHEPKERMPGIKARETLSVTKLRHAKTRYRKLAPLNAAKQQKLWCSKQEVACPVSETNTYIRPNTVYDVG